MQYREHCNKKEFEPSATFEEREEVHQNCKYVEQYAVFAYNQERNIH